MLKVKQGTTQRDLYWIFKNKSLIDVNKRSIRFYCKLKKFCNKNLKEYHTLKQNERKK
jgi:hypothetical protein